MIRSVNTEKLARFLLRQKFIIVDSDKFDSPTMSEATTIAQLVKTFFDIPENVEENALAEQLKKTHYHVPKIYCNARTVREVEHYQGNTSEKKLVCTELAGHEGRHLDAICCWKFHSFDEGEPENNDKGGCACGRHSCDVLLTLKLGGFA